MGLADALGPLVDTPTAKRSGAQAAKRLDAQTTKRSKEDGRPGLPLQGVAKSRHPQWEKKTVYVRTETHKRALRKFEDAGGKEFSDLVERLLEEYARG